MDFSLLQAHASKPFLRDITALKRTWVYYVIGVVDPILRFSWIFYAIFTHNTQHSTIISFFVAFAEVVRRGMWTLLRVENEHCANVAQYKASRDTPLPYHIDTSPEQTGDDESPEPREASNVSPSSAAISMGITRTRTQGSVRISTGTDRRPSFAEGPQPEEAGMPFRRRRSDTLGKRSILQVMAEAHKEDFEKKKPAEDSTTERLDEDDERSEEDDDDDTGSASEERRQLREVESLMKDVHDGGGH